MPAPNHLALRIESRQHGIAFRTIRREMHDTVFVGDLGNQRVSRCILCRPQPVDGNNSFDIRAVDLARRKPILVGLRDDEAVGLRLRSRQIDRFIDGGGTTGPSFSLFSSSQAANATERHNANDHAARTHFFLINS